MILYLDTSALIKAYVEEKHSKIVLQAMAANEIVASQVISFVELHAGLARLRRENRLTENDINKIKQQFKNDWKNYLQVEITEIILTTAAEYAEAFALRAYDSMQLAAAQFLLKHAKQPVVFGCFDNRLNQAAHILGLNLLPIKD